MRKFLLIAVLAGTMLFASCKKEGTGGESEIEATVRHHNEIIPGATIYIKYGAKEFPGTDLSKYDDSKVTGKIDHPHTHFGELHKGDYYLYAIGYDSAIAMPVTGGIHVSLGKHDHKAVDVPATE